MIQSVERQCQRAGLVVALVALLIAALGAQAEARGPVVATSPDPFGGDGITLVAVGADGTERPFAVDHTDVTGELVAGYASVIVTQTFVNPFDQPLEGIYRFPLPHDAAVDRMGLIVGKRFIEAEVRERQEARDEYEMAVEEGRHAALTEEKRPNLFEQRIANIMPGEKVHVTLHYAAAVAYDGGEWTFAFPTVVGPRYVPPRTVVTDPDKAAVNPAYTAPGVDIAHRISMQLDLRPGAEIFQVHAPSHELKVEHAARGEAWILMANPDEVPNRTIEVRYRLASTKPVAAVIAHKGAKDEVGTFVMTLEPPRTVRAADVTPKEMIFVVDTSGSMMGEPMDKAKAAMRYALNHMGPKDSFQVLDFASGVAAMADAPLENTPENLTRGLAFVDAMSSAGGTEMLTGIKAAIEPRADAQRMRIVCFMTDGYIGNDEEILSYIRDHIGGARLFSFGVGEEVNRHLLTGMSRLGRGAVQYVRLGAQADPVEDVVERFYHRIGQPLLTDIRVDWGGLRVDEVVPTPIPDLFVGQALRVFGRYETAGKAEAKIHGRIAGKPVVIPMSVELPAVEERHDVLEVMWARKTIDGLLSESEWEDSDEAREEVTQMGLKYHLLTRYTSFVAVERDLIVNPSPDNLRRALAAVHMPAGVAHEGIFGKPKTGAELGPFSIKPGDPEILVHAPRQSRRVVAVLPWGQRVECGFEEVHDAWLGRFLVPREAEEGLYRVRIFVEGPTGEVETMTVWYEVDATAPRMSLELDVAEADPGAEVAVVATPTEIVQAAGRTVRFRSDVRRAVLRVVGTDVEVPLRASDGGRQWRGKIALPDDLAPGVYSVELVVTDMAANIHRTTTELTVR